MYLLLQTYCNVAVKQFFHFIGKTKEKYDEKENESQSEPINKILKVGYWSHFLVWRCSKTQIYRQ